MFLLVFIAVSYSEPDSSKNSRNVKLGRYSLVVCEVDVSETHGHVKSVDGWDLENALGRCVARKV